LNLEGALTNARCLSNNAHKTSFYPKSGLRLQSHHANLLLSDRLPPGVGNVIHVTSISRCPAGTDRRSAVASPPLTKSCNIPIGKPCASGTDLVQSPGESASIRSASRWAMGIGNHVPVPPAHLRYVVVVTNRV
jgi:hypothetical protein